MAPLILVALSVMGLILFPLLGIILGVTLGMAFAKTYVKLLRRFP